ncbi:MAG TPA: hypothetical protein VJX10_07845 [Pseudonocardiaceae bacterium]|nr:hypothetical protein [Pseudonocardiaceae bacterium]
MLVIIDCDKCAIRGVGCSDCVVSVLLTEPGTVELTDPELKAINALGDAGLVPKLRLVPIDSDGPRHLRDEPAESDDTPAAAGPSAERSARYVGRHRRQVS